MNKLFAYSGNKGKFCDTFNTLTKDVKSTIYYEPFLGSGMIFNNLEDKFDVYHLNDLNSHIISTFEFCRDCTYEDLIDIKHEMESRYGSYRNKASWYEIRAHYNENYFNTDKIEAGGYLIHIINSTINSFARFGENGYNSSFGSRHFIPNKRQYINIKNKLKKSILSAKSYDDICYEKDSLIFFDPPLDLMKLLKIRL